MKRKNAFNVIILILITCLVLYFSLKSDYKTVIETISKIKIQYLFLAILLYVFSIYVKSIIIYLMTKEYNNKYKFNKAFKMEIEVNFFSGITPFSTGGQPYELYRLNKDSVKAMDATNICIQNFIVYQIVLVFLGVLAIIYNNNTNVFSSVNYTYIFVILGFIINSLVIVTLITITFNKKIKKYFIEFIVKFLLKIRVLKNKESTLEKLNKYLLDFDSGAKVLFKKPKKFILMLVLSFISTCVLYSIPLAILIGISGAYNIGLINTVAASAYVMLIGSFVPIPGGSGGLEYAFVKFFGTFVGGSKINAIMILWRIVTFYFAMLLGAIFLGFRKKV